MSTGADVPSPAEGPGVQASRVLDVGISGGPVVTGKEVFVTAAILLLGSTTSGQWNKLIDFDADAGPVLFHVTASGFALLSKNKIPLSVPQGADSERVVFNLRVVEALDHWICLTLFQKRNPIAQITIKDFSALSEQQEQREQDRIGLLFHADLTLIARSDSSVIEAWSEHNDLNGVSMKIFKSPTSHQYQLLRNVIRLLNDSKADPREQERELKIVGAGLRKCLPDDLITILASGSVKTLCLHHDKAVDFPFELCWFDEHGGFFLGDRTAVCRWFIDIRRVPRPRHAPVSSVAVLLGKSSASKLAVEMLQNVLPKLEIFKTKREVVEKVLMRRD